MKARLFQSFDLHAQLATLLFRVSNLQNVLNTKLGLKTCIIRVGQNRI